MDDLLVGLVAFLWWKRDHDKDEHAPEPEPQFKGDPNVARAWDAVVTEWEPER